MVIGNKTLVDNLEQIAYTLDKAYLDNLARDYHALPFNSDESVCYENNIRVIRVDRCVLDKNVKTADCIKNVLSYFADGDHNIAVVFIRSHTETKMYFVVQNYGAAMNEVSGNNLQMLDDSLKGNFPGIHTTIVETKEAEKIFSFDKANSVSLLVNTPTEYAEDSLSQGIERLLDGVVPATEDEIYGIILLAESLDKETIRNVLSGYFKGRVSYWGIDNPSLEEAALRALIECGATIGCAMYIMLKPGNTIPEIEGFKIVGVAESANTVSVKKINLISIEDKKKWILENTHLLIGQGIIYCNEEADCPPICKALKKQKIKAEAYIQIEQEENAERINYLTNTFTQGGLPIIATTHETGKNLTNPNLRFIIHYDVPERNIYDIHVGQLVYSPDSVVYDLVVSQRRDSNENGKVNTASTLEKTEAIEQPESVAVPESTHISGNNTYHKTQEGTFRSWNVSDQETAVKTCDDDFIYGNASGVPKDMCGFFDADDFVNGQSCELRFIYEKQSYRANVSADYSPSRRIKIRWDAVLGREFKRLKSINAISKVSFHRSGNKTYELTVI